MEQFVDSRAHLLAELERLDLLIRLQVARVRKLQSDDEQFRGLYISEPEVDALLNQPLGRPYWMASESAPMDELEPLIRRLAQRIDAFKQRTLEAGVKLPLHDLQQRFGLEPMELDILLVCVAVELDLRYERLYAYLQDDVTKKKPTVDLALNLLCATADGKLNARRCFLPTAPLFRYQLVDLVDDPSQARSSLLGKFLKVDDRIVAYLFGDDVLDVRLRAFVEAGMPSLSLDELPLEANFKQGLRGLVRGSGRGNGLTVYLHGPYGAGKRMTAEAVAREAGLKLMEVDLRAMAAENLNAVSALLELIKRESMLSAAAVSWSEFDTLLSEQNRALLTVFLRHLSDSPYPHFILGESLWQPDQTLPGVSFVRLPLPRPSYAERVSLWRDTTHGKNVADADLDALASKFKFTPGQIRDSVRTAENIARWRDFEAPRIDGRDLYEACRLHSNQRLSALANKIVPRYRWGDIVLPVDRLSQLREICNHVKYRDRVYSDWGFDQKLAMGKGLCVLFAGPSGTGKTMAADIIAGELGLDLYKIDLSTVVSKYIGETEKNLSRIFSEAETSNAILFFDEADALFGKRSEVKDSHDRYANIETGYLLQRMEEHEGVVILASNFRKNMDEAFVRRLHFTVEFPFPNEEDRRRIWEGVWPEAVPRDPALDMGLLAGRFQMTGGNIRNIALSAAFLAADDGGSVGMRHLFRATQREFQKMGKVVTDAEFREHRQGALPQ